MNPGARLHVLKRLGLGFCMVLALSVHDAMAGVSVPQKLVFPGDQQEIGFKLDNPGQMPSMLQLWIDDGDEDAATESLTAPFLLAPSLLRLEPQESRRLRLHSVDAASSLPQDRESLFHLNVLDVPPTPESDADNGQLLIAVRYRLRLLYRPDALPPAETAALAAAVRWSLRQASDGHWQLHGFNPSAHYLFFRQLTLVQDSKEQALSLATSDQLAPHETRVFPIPADWSPRADSQLTYLAVDDHSQTVAGHSSVSIDSHGTTRPETETAHLSHTLP